MMFYKGLTQQFLHMDKLGQERLLQCLVHIGMTTQET